MNFVTNDNWALHILHLQSKDFSAYHLMHCAYREDFQIRGELYN